MITSNHTSRRKVKAYIWKPKNDIKVSEIARCIRFITNPICLDASLIDPDCLRHFEVTMI
ncbi:hypothetical protein [Dyadobacter sp. 676]|uniref:Uncharacterized protein n=1 Tax=Dyadobacter sp. 676 TaxID=3088362 RepID=A0AAU8FP15_9BACT